ncbi:MAG: hypothetical protein LBK94_05240, partial [Prevotellaceae bacterium]|nr:hypothetical protein [Prevotellaceae bacterium]
DELINQLTCGIIRYDISSCEAKIIYKKRQKAEQAEQKEKTKLVLLDKNEFTVLVSANNYGLTRKYKTAPNSKSVN